MNSGANPESSPCDHCGLPVAPGDLDPAAKTQFCCSGCRTVFAAIHELGLEQFYRLRAEDDAGIRPVPAGGDYDAFDHESFQEVHVGRAASGASTVELCLEGMHCSACVWLIERLPRVLPGVIESRVDIGRQRVAVTWDGPRVPLSRIANTLDSLGYPCHPSRGGSEEAWRRREDRRRLIDMAVAGALAANVMLISFALFGGMFAEMRSEFRQLFRWAGLLLTMLAVVWPGRTFLRGAVSSLRARALHMDVPVALALVAGTAWGAANTIRASGETYFESMTAVIFLLLIGRYITHRQQRSAQDALALLFCLTPQTAKRIEGNDVQEVPVEGLARGDRIELLPGDTVPADGLIAAGESTFDLSLLTGESRPVARGSGDNVFSGTVNLGRRVELQVETTGAETRLGRLMILVEQLAGSRPPIVRLADRVAHYFVITVVLVAMATAVFWWSDGPGQAIENAMALLIVTCPCALGLATPLAMAAAIGRAAHRGILIKGADALERLATPGLMLLDKTGTLTRGRTRLELWEGDDEILPTVVAVESGVNHPIAQAFVEAHKEIAPDDASYRITQVPGCGVHATRASERFAIGSATWITGQGARLPEWARQAIVRCADRGLSPVLVTHDDTVVAVGGFGDSPHPDAVGALEQLREIGWKLRLLSGDARSAVTSLARQVGLTEDDVEAEVSPEQKVETVERHLAEQEPVVMVGDGVNDAAALTAASVGVAVKGGAEASLAAADVFLRRPGLTPLVELIHGAQRTLGVIRLNIGVALLYNLIAGGLAVTGHIDPLIAAVLMPISSLTVVTLSYRRRTFSG